MPLTQLLARCQDLTALRAFVDRANASGPYHRMDFGNGYVIDGEFDLGKVLRHYHLPDSLAGRTVLDVGTYNGFWATTCAARGGRVTAVDLYDPPGFVSDIATLFALPIEYRQCDVYDLNGGAGRFDLVICGSLLLHLMDPMRALINLRRVCQGQVVVSTSCTPDSETNPERVCVFTGEHHKTATGSYWRTWQLSRAALERMLLAAGFARIDWHEHYMLESESGQSNFSIKHVVVGASVP